MSPTQAASDENGFIDVTIPDHDDKALKELLIWLDGSDGQAPTSLPAGWDKASAGQRLSEHLRLIDSEIARKMKGLEDLNAHLAGLQIQEVQAPPKQPGTGAIFLGEGRVELVPQHSAPCCGAGREQTPVYTPRVPQHPITTSVQPNWCVRNASPSPAFQRISSTPATFRGRIYKVPGTASAGCFMVPTVPVPNTASVPTIRAPSPIVTVRSGSVGAGTRVVTSVPVQCHGTPGSPRVLNPVHSPDSRTRCNSPVPAPAQLIGAAIFPKETGGRHGMPQRHGSRPPRAAHVAQTSWQAAMPQHVSSRFILVSPYMAEAPRMERCATPTRVASRPRAGASPTRPAIVHRIHTPRG
ncbi:unnamed protein product [Cladocopium goreaui]|uniref:Uncharacterized protein n=1 Tax=Cladocopium goreaui TaxID=2562237 RepID=A0A9P1C0N3_9DINO|nr:unnamed protein product [Cladocopium goreaui]